MRKRRPTKTSFGKGNRAAKGHDGSKTGRPREEAKGALRDLLTTPREVTVGKGKKAKKETISMRDLALRTLERALSGSGATAVKAAELILAYTDGPPKQQNDLSGEVTLVHKYQR